MRLPYDPRPGQRELVELIGQVQGDQGHAVVEAGTGTGKTIAALTASLTTASKDGRRVVYATRTNSQQSQVVKEHQALWQAGAEPGLLVPFMGRRQYCPLLRHDIRFQGGSPEELGRLCRDAKRKAVQEMETGQTVAGACPYYKRLLLDGTDPVEALLEGGGLDAHAMAEKVTACGSCPYEALKALLPRAQTVVVPAIFVVDNKLREVLGTWLGVGLDEVHLVVDEAHHLPEAARDHYSPQLTAAILRRATKEAGHYHDPVLAGRLLSTSLLHAVEQSLHALVQDHVMETDGRVPPGALQEHLMQRLRLPTPALLAAACDMEAWGETIREDRRARNRLPRSYLGSVGTFLRFWLEAEAQDYAHLVTTGDNPGIEALLLDPSARLAWLHDCASSLHFSGTMAPVQGHVQRCGLPHDTTTKVFSSPYKNQLRIIGVEGLHRRWALHQEDPAHALRQQDATLEVLAQMSGKTALFFPSHAMLKDWVEEGFLHHPGLPVYQELPDSSTAELMRLVNDFTNDSQEAVLLGVLGGRLAEGLDFPGTALEKVIVLGIPYPRPSARLQALIDFEDRVHDGKGWTHMVHDPVGRTMRQAVGRLVRGPSDQGTAIILDERVARFRSHLKGLEMVSQVSEIQPALSRPHEEPQDFVPAGRLLTP